MSILSACQVSALLIWIIGLQVQLVHCNWFALPVDHVCLSVCTSFCTSHFDNRLPSAIGSMQMLCTACRSCLSDCPSAALICPSEDCNWFILCPVDQVCCLSACLSVCTSHLISKMQMVHSLSCRSCLSVRLSALPIWMIGYQVQLVSCLSVCTPHLIIYVLSII